MSLPIPQRASADLEDWPGYIARGTEGKKQETGVIAYQRNRNHLPPVWVGPAFLLLTRKLLVSTSVSCQPLEETFECSKETLCPQSHLLSLGQGNNSLLAYPQQKDAKLQGPATIRVKDQENREQAAKVGMGHLCL